MTEFYSRGPYSDHGIFMDYECDYDTYYQTDCVDGISIRQTYELDIGIKIGNDEYPESMNSHAVTFASTDIIYRGCVCEKRVVTDLTNNKRFAKYVFMEFRGVIEFYDRLTGLPWKLKD